MVEVLAERRFYGRTETRADVGAIRVFESRYEQGLSLPAHSHENAHLCYVVDGAYTERLGTSRVDRGPGVIVFYPAGSAHSERHHACGRHLLIELTPPWMDRLESPSDAIPAGATLGGPVAVGLAARMLRELRARDTATPLIIEGLIAELLGWLQRRSCRPEPRSGAPWLPRVWEVLADRFREPLTLWEVADEAGVHAAHLTRVFRREFGCTVGDHLRRLRVDYACRRIAESDEPLSQIAVDAGFCDQSHLCREFKARFGRTPASIRANRIEH